MCCHFLTVLGNHVQDVMLRRTQDLCEYLKQKSKTDSITFNNVFQAESSGPADVLTMATHLSHTRLDRFALMASLWTGLLEISSLVLGLSSQKFTELEVD